MCVSESEKKLLVVLAALGEHLERMEFERSIDKSKIEYLEKELEKAKERVADLEAKERGEWN